MERKMAIDSGATAWILASTALVMIMTPGVGFFYGGLVRRKNFISMITLSFVAFALVSIQWVLIRVFTRIRSGCWRVYW